MSSFLREKGRYFKAITAMGGLCRLSVGPGQVAPLPPPPVPVQRKFPLHIEERREVMSIQAILYEKGANVETIAPDVSVKDAAARLREKNIAALVATKGDAILGIISEREIVPALSSHGERAASMNVGDILMRDIATVGPEDSLRRAMGLMTRYRTRHLPVLRGNKLVGIVSMGDVIKHRLEDLELETNVLRDAYIAVH